MPEVQIEVVPVFQKERAAYVKKVAYARSLVADLYKTGVWLPTARDSGHFMCSRKYCPYWQECEKKGLEPEPGATETFRNRMMTFVNMDDPGLVVLPTHRVVHSIPDFDLDDFEKKVAENFVVEPIAFSDSDKKEKFESAMERLAQYGAEVDMLDLAEVLSEQIAEAKGG